MDNFSLVFPGGIKWEHCSETSQYAIPSDVVEQNSIFNLFSTEKICSLVTGNTRINLISIMNFRSSHQKCPIQTCILQNFTKFTGKQHRQSLNFNKVAGLRPATLLKNRAWNRCFPVNFVKFLRTTTLKNICRRLLLDFCCHFLRSQSTLKKWKL